MTSASSRLTASTDFFYHIGNLCKYRFFSAICNGFFYNFAGFSLPQSDLEKEPPRTVATAGSVCNNNIIQYISAVYRAGKHILISVSHNIHDINGTSCIEFLCSQRSNIFALLGRCCQHQRRRIFLHQFCQHRRPHFRTFLFGLYNDCLIRTGFNGCFCRCIRLFCKNSCDNFFTFCILPVLLPLPESQVPGNLQVSPSAVSTYTKIFFPSVRLISCDLLQYLGIRDECHCLGNMPLPGISALIFTPGLTFCRCIYFYDFHR